MSEAPAAATRAVNDDKARAVADAHTNTPATGEPSPFTGPTAAVELPGWRHPQELRTQAMADLSDFQQVAINQAKTAFWFLISAAVLGFFLVAYVAWRASTARTTGGQVSAGAIGVAGAGVAAYIGRTFQRAYVEAKDQVTEYLAQPLSQTRIGNAEQIIETMNVSSEARDHAALELVLAALSTTDEPISRPRPGRSPGRKHQPKRSKAKDPTARPPIVGADSGG